MKPQTKTDRQRSALERRKQELAYWQDESSPAVKRLMADFADGATRHVQKIKVAKQDIVNLEKKLARVVAW